MPFSINGFRAQSTLILDTIPYSGLSFTKFHLTLSFTKKQKNLPPYRASLSCYKHRRALLTRANLKVSERTKRIATKKLTVINKAQNFRKGINRRIRIKVYTRHRGCLKKTDLRNQFFGKGPLK
jgi:hypothetical protein